MTYEEALKATAGKTPAVSQTFLRIKFGYQAEVILPYKQGIQMLEAMQQGWFYAANYSSPPEFRPIKTEDFEMHICSQEEVQEIQMAKLLGVSIHDLKTLAEQQNQKPLSEVA